MADTGFLSRLLQSRPQARGTYTIKAVCKNCGRGAPDGEDMIFDMGVPIKDHACKTCGCLSLKSVFDLPKRAASASHTPPEKSVPDGSLSDVFLAMTKLGFSRQEARDAVLAVMKDHPTEKDPTQLLALAIRSRSSTC